MVNVIKHKLNTEIWSLAKDLAKPANTVLG